MQDLINRDAAIEALAKAGIENYAAAGHDNGMLKAVNVIKAIPAAQPTQTNAEPTQKCVGSTQDCVSRQEAIDAINKLIDRFERILRDIRETNEDESVCGLCEYDGAFIGQSGDWCNECPGFDKADCFKLSDERRKKWLKELGLPSAQPQRTKERWAPMFNGRFTGGAYWFSCSGCKRIVPDVRNGGWNYCPACGADMMEAGS